MSRRFRRLKRAGTNVGRADRLTIERELGKPVEALSASSAGVPVALASLIRTHQATLPDQAAVAVLVKTRPWPSRRALSRRHAVGTAVASTAVEG